MTTAPSTTSTPHEIRCPLPHPSHPNRPACDRLLMLYGTPTAATVSLRCPRCKGTVTLVVRST